MIIFLDSTTIYYITTSLFYGLKGTKRILTGKRKCVVNGTSQLTSMYVCMYIGKARRRREKRLSSASVVVIDVDTERGGGGLYLFNP